MTRRLRWARGLTAAAVALVFSASMAVSPARGEDAPEKKGFFNHLRGGDASASAEVPAGTPEAAEAPAPAPTPLSVSAAYDVKSLRSPIEKIRRSILGTDPSVVSYLDRIERGEATAAQLNDFAGYLLRRGVPNIAEPFQRAATEIAPEQPSFWVNLGTIEQARGKSRSATGAYKKAIDLDPTNGLAHYGLGVVADAQGDYDGALEHYRRALLIDPTLADPKVNPQVVNNEKMLAVRLLLAQERSGALSLPLLPGKPEEKRGDSEKSTGELPPSDQ